MDIEHKKMSPAIEGKERAERLLRLRAAMKALRIPCKPGSEVGAIPVSITPDGSIDDGGDAVENELWEAYNQIKDSDGLTLDERIGLVDYSISGSDLSEAEFFEMLPSELQAHYLKTRLGTLLELELGAERSPTVVPVGAIYEVARFEVQPEDRLNRGRIELHMKQMGNAGLPLPEVLSVLIANRQEQRFSPDHFVPGEHLEIRGLSKWGFCFWRKISLKG